MTYVDSVIKAFGGVRPMARAIKRPASTVHLWKQRGRIPDWHHLAISAAASRAGIAVELPKAAE